MLVWAAIHSLKQKCRKETKPVWSKYIQLEVKCILRWKQTRPSQWTLCPRLYFYVSTAGLTFTVLYLSYECGRLPLILLWSRPHNSRPTWPMAKLAFSASIKKMSTQSKNKRHEPWPARLIKEKDQKKKENMEWRLSCWIPMKERKRVKEEDDRIPKRQLSHIASVWNNQMVLFMWSRLHHAATGHVQQLNYCKASEWQANGLLWECEEPPRGEMHACVYFVTFATSSRLIFGLFSFPSLSGFSSREWGCPNNTWSNDGERDLRLSSVLQLTGRTNRFSVRWSLQIEKQSLSDDLLHGEQYLYITWPDRSWGTHTQTYTERTYTDIHPRPHVETHGRFHNELRRESTWSI